MQMCKMTASEVFQASVFYWRDLLSLAWNLCFVTFTFTLHFHAQTAIIHTQHHTKNPPQCHVTIAKCISRIKAILVLDYVSLKH